MHVNFVHPHSSLEIALTTTKSEYIENNKCYNHRFASFSKPSGLKLLNLHLTLTFSLGMGVGNYPYFSCLATASLSWLWSEGLGRHNVREGIGDLSSGFFHFTSFQLDDSLTAATFCNSIKEVTIFINLTFSWFHFLPLKRNANLLAYPENHHIHFKLWVCEVVHHNYDYLLLVLIVCPNFNQPAETPLLILMIATTFDNPCGYPNYSLRYVDLVPFTLQLLYASECLCFLSNKNEIE